MTQTIKKKYLESHEIGEIYIHDIECIPTGITGFTELELSEKLEEDFAKDRNIREEEMDIYSYTNIISNIILLTSREQYYGEGIPAFDFLLAKAVLKTFKQNFKKILLEYLEFTEFLQFLPMNGILREIEKIESIEFDLNIFKGYLRESDKVFGIFKKVYELSIKKTEKDTYNAIMLFVNNINVLSEERERKLIFSLNLGTDISKEGRLVTKTLFKVLNTVEMNKKNSIIEIVFKLSKKINFTEKSINYDLFLESLNLNLETIKYSMLDSTFNKEKYTENNYLTEVAYLNGIRIIDNNLDDKRTIVGGRGLLGIVSINLVGLAIKENKENKRFSKKSFLTRLEQVLLAARQVLYDRFEELSEKSRKDYPMLFGHNLWLESDKIKEDDKLRRALKHGILGIGFNGLYEALLAIYKKNKIEEIKEAQELGLEIIKTIRKKCDKFSEENNLNYQVIALPEEYDKDMFIDIDQIIHGKIKGVTDKEYYTNSFKIKLNNLDERIKWEAPFHKYTNAGHTFILEPREYNNDNEKLKEILNILLRENIGFVEVRKNKTTEIS